jgi:hypothetical protein
MRFMGCIYCYRAGALDLFKIGHTKNAAAKRMKNVQTGSWEVLSIYRQVETDHAPRLLEDRIHKLLAAYRAKRGEFFHVTTELLDRAVDDAKTFLTEYLPIIQQVKKLQHHKPNPEVLQRTDNIDAVCQELKKAKQEQALLIELLQGKLQVAIGKNAGIESVASWKWQEKFIFDLGLFKADRPALFKQYQKSSGTRYFRLL